MGPRPSGPVLSPLGIKTPPFFADVNHCQKYEKKIISALSRPVARIAQTVKLYEVVVDPEIVFFGQSLFRFLEKSNLFINKIGVVDDTAAARADKVVMMPLALRTFSQFISGPPMSKIKFMDQADIHENIQRPVNGRQSYRGIDGMDFHVNIFSAQMFICLRQDIQNRFAAGCHSVTAAPELPVTPLARAFTVSMSHGYFLNENGFHYLLPQEGASVKPFFVITVFLSIYLKTL
jgi:hypothetical protein